MAVPHSKTTVSLETNTEITLFKVLNEVLANDMNGVQFNEVVFERLTEGTTNAVWKITILSTDMKPLVCHVYGKGTNTYINRETDLNISLFLGNKKGISGAILATFENGTIGTYLEGRSLTKDELCDHIDLVAERLASIHLLTDEWEDFRKANCPNLKVAMFWDVLLLWTEQILSKTQTEKTYLENLGFSLSDIKEEQLWLEKRLNDPIAYPVSLCHNDYGGQNVIYNESTKTLQVIDFEYTMYNHRYFDLANLFCEFGGLVRSGQFPSVDIQNAYLVAYLRAMKLECTDPKNIEKIRKEVVEFSMCSSLLWGVWSLLRLCDMGTSTFNYNQYAKQRFAEYATRKLDLGLGKCSILKN